MTSPAILIVAPTKRELGGLRETNAYAPERERDARAAIRETERDEDAYAPEREKDARAAIRETERDEDAYAPEREIERETAGNIRIALCGIGREAGERVAALLDAAPCSLLVSLGFAGALDPALRPGDLIIANVFLYADAPSLLAPPDPLLLSSLPSFPRRRESRGRADTDPLSLQGERDGERVLAPPGPLLTVDAPLLTPAAKRRARAASGAAVVDMEGRRIAEAAAERGVPIVAVRAVIDEADFALPPFAAEIAAAGGHDERARAFRAAANPREAAGMLLLALRARKAARSLRRAADAILAAQPERP